MVTAEATLEDLVWLLNRTPSNIVVVSYDVWLEHDCQIPVVWRKAVSELNKDGELWKVVWSRCGAVLGKTTRVSDVHWKLKIDECPHRFLCCEVRIRKSHLSIG